MQKIARKITSAIQHEKPELSDLQLRTIQFGLECLLGEVTKIIIYSIVFSLLSLTDQFITAMIFFTTIRLVAGGYHEDTYWRCFFTSLGLFTVIIGAGVYLPIGLDIKMIMFMMALVLMWVYAPVDHPNKPIISATRRRRFKYISVSITILMGVIGFLLPEMYSGTAMTAILIEAVSLPAGKYMNGRKCI
ncbi:MAG: accessory gene regulator ArgB-like protein [Clostridia bacterium]